LGFGRHEWEGIIMRYESFLKRAQGLGSAKSGVYHWLLQRITAFALIPLGLWFVGFFLLLLSAPYPEAIHFFSSPWTVTLAISFIIVLFYHASLSMQVIWEDYVPHELTRWCLVMGTHLLSFFLAILSILSILKIYLT